MESRYLIAYLITSRKDSREKRENMSDVVEQVRIYKEAMQRDIDLLHKYERENKLHPTIQIALLLRAIDIAEEMEAL